MLPILLFLTAILLDAAPFVDHPDRLIRLPGAPLIPDFPLYAGFLNGSTDGNCRMFYLLTESIRVDPLSAPLLIWFNGGPGGSSLAGMFTENGPYRVTEAGDVLTYNEFSWNQYANVLYLESPVGVGFSHNENGEPIELDDDTTAELNFNALKDFMTGVHSRYANRDFYLSGQSYAGAYVPFLSRRLLQGISSGELDNNNFKGFAIGNAVIEHKSVVLAEAVQFLAYGQLDPKYTERILETWTKMERGELNNSDTSTESIERFVYHAVLEKFGINSAINYNFAEHCLTETDEAHHGAKEAKKTISCYGKTAMVSYLNRIDVQMALHMSNATTGIHSWRVINKQMVQQYNRTRDVIPVYTDILNLAKSPFRMLIYNGDTDVMMSPMHAVYCTSKIAEENNMKLTSKGSWDFFGDFAGARYEYRRASDNITMDVLTVRGSGHSVPTDLPAQAFQMINNFIFADGEKPVNFSQPIKKH